MTNQIKHFSLHRVAGTELQVVSDVESGVLSLIQVEEGVIQDYARQGAWPHTRVVLFVLQDLAPLTRQLTTKGELWRETLDDLDSRPVANIYDLSDLSQCHLFVNQQAMIQAGYWNDLPAVRGLLAHEHAHPLSECQTVRFSRHVRATHAWEIEADIEGEHHEGGTTDRALAPRIDQLLQRLVTKLCLYAPREILANELVIRSGFGDNLLYLDRQGVRQAIRSVAGRDDLLGDLQRRVAEGTLSPSMVALLLLLGDMTSYLEQALEISAFFRAGHEREAEELELGLKDQVFVHLEREFQLAYEALRRQYLELHEDMTAQAHASWTTGILAILVQALASKGLILRSQLEVENSLLKQ
jgi:hypothetical protein